MSKKFEREFQKHITSKTNWILDSYKTGGKHYLCKIRCEGCDLHDDVIVFPNGNGTSISTSPSASNAWNSIKSQIRKVHREHLEKR
tara:strand:+ start:323 stop:580 length:258 start_codon:yes stop_codon:yes gene_type:complete